MRSAQNARLRDILPGRYGQACSSVTRSETRTGGGCAGKNENDDEGGVMEEAGGAGLNATSSFILPPSSLRLVRHRELLAELGDFPADLRQRGRVVLGAQRPVDVLHDRRHVPFLQSASRDGGRSQPDAAGDLRRPGVVQDGVLV